MDFISVIIFLGIAQGILFGILLLTIERGNRKANRLFGILMIIFAISIVGFELTRLNLYSSFPFLVGVPTTVIPLFGPLFLYYVKFLTLKDFNIRKREMLHFLPFIILCLYRLPLWIKGSEEKMLILNDKSFHNESFIIIAILTLHIFVYVFLIKRETLKYVERIKNELSSIDKMNLKWIYIGMNSFLIVFSVLAIFLIMEALGIKGAEYFQVVIPIMVSFTILFMGYWSLKQPIVFPVEEENSKIKKYEKSSLTEERAGDKLNQLLELMENEKVFMRSDLTLQKLANMLSISPHHLSQILNDRINQNFFDFINSYRIEEAKRLLSSQEGELLTILAIAEEVGFNSKSAFNNAFKKNTGLTPTQFKDSIKISV
jgi:AraC-like DNA-binding protein